MAPPTWSLDRISDNLSRTDLEWNTPVITFGFPTTAPSWSAGEEGRGFSPAAAAQKAVPQNTGGGSIELVRESGEWRVVDVHGP